MPKLCARSLHLHPREQSREVQLMETISVWSSLPSKAQSRSLQHPSEEPGYLDRI